MEPRFCIRSADSPGPGRFHRNLRFTSPQLYTRARARPHVTRTDQWIGGQRGNLPQRSKYLLQSISLWAILSYRQTARQPIHLSTAMNIVDALSLLTWSTTATITALKTNQGHRCTLTELLDATCSALASGTLEDTNDGGRWCMDPAKGIERLDYMGYRIGYRYDIDTAGEPAPQAPADKINLAKTPWRDARGNPVHIPRPVVRHYAVITADGSGPAFGVGHTVAEAIRDAAVYGLDELTGTKTIEITPDSYKAVKSGNPDAWRRA